MGRSGGGGGGHSGGGGFSGGGGSGGGFSGGRGGSGGRSGGHSYSGGHSGHSYSGGHSYYGGGLGPIIFFGGGNHVNPSPHHSNQNSSSSSGQNTVPVRRGAGCGTIILVCLFFFFLMTILSALTGNSSTQGSSISPSTQEREKLPASAVNLTAYYTDADGDWIHNSYTLEEGMKQFYDETGVQPYVYILPNGETESTSELQAFAEEQYNQLFNDEGHFLLAFCDNGYGGYNCGYWMGNQASTVMDSEAVEILQNYLSYYYSDMDISEEEIFSLTFSKTGSRIMTVTKSEMPKIVIAFIILAIVMVIYMIIRRRQEAAREKAEQTEAILNTPLETYAQHELDELEGKYDQAKPGAAQAQTAQAQAPVQPAPAPAAPAQPAPAAPTQPAPAAQQPQVTQQPQVAQQPTIEDEFKDPELVALEEKYKKLEEEAKAAAQAQDEAQS